MIQLQFIKTHETSFLSSQNVSVGGKEYTLYIINSSGHYKSKKYKRQCLYIFHNSHNLQIEIYALTLILLIYVITRKDIVIRRKDLVRNYELINYLIITKKYLVLISYIVIVVII